MYPTPDLYGVLLKFKKKQLEEIVFLKNTSNCYSLCIGHCAKYFTQYLIQSHTSLCGHHLLSSTAQDNGVQAGQKLSQWQSHGWASAAILCAGKKGSKTHTLLTSLHGKFA